MNNSFCSNFWANFLSDFIVGVAFGTLLAWWVGRRLNNFQRIQQRKDEKRVELEKSIHYLKLLTQEINHLLCQLHDLKDLPQPYVGPEKIKITTPFWDILKPSGELPKLICPQQLELLTRFYDHMMYAAKALEWYMDRLVYSDVAKSYSLTQDEIGSAIKCGLEQADQVGKNLPDKLNKEIQLLEERLKTL